MFYKCNLNGVNFIKPKDWALQSGSLKAIWFYTNNLHFVKDGNIKLFKSKVNVIKRNCRTTESVLMSSKLFSHAADFNFNDKDFLILPCSMTVFDTVRSSKLVCTSHDHTSKPVCTSHAH